MTLLNHEALVGLLSVHQPPCLSLYQPTHRRHPENRQDSIRFRNLVKRLEASLRERYSASETQSMLEPFDALARDPMFWAHTLDGLAVLSASGLVRVFRLPRPVVELTVVADSFHVKPLWRFLQSVDRYQVLGLTRHEMHLYEGDRDGLHEIDLAAEVPRTITDALGDELTEPHQTVASYGGTGSAMHHGHGGKADEVDLDAERFFRAVDRSVLEHHSRPSGLPLILAALGEHHHRFHQVSHNPFLVSEGIRINPAAVTTDQLGALAWEVLAPHYEARLTALENEFQHARSKGLGSDDLAVVAQAAAGGRVASLLIEANRTIAGRLDPATGAVEFGDLHDPGVDDLLDDLGEQVGKMGGQVLVIASERMPSKTGVAAIFRY